MYSREDSRLFFCVQKPKRKKNETDLQINFKLRTFYTHFWRSFNFLYLGYVPKSWRVDNYRLQRSQKPIQNVRKDLGDRWPDILKNQVFEITIRYDIWFRTPRFEWKYNSYLSNVNFLTIFNKKFFISTS